LFAWWINRIDSSHSVEFNVKPIFPHSIQYDVVIIAITISLITGILSGLAPAYTAAKMDPVMH